jgi:hypothetical protein
MALVVLVLVGVLAWLVYAAGRRRAATDLLQATAAAESELLRLAQQEEKAQRARRLGDATIALACRGNGTAEQLAKLGNEECLFAAYETAEASGWEDLEYARNVAASEIHNRRGEARRLLGQPHSQSDKIDFLALSIALSTLEDQLGARAMKRSSLAHVSDADISGAIESRIVRDRMAPDAAHAARAVMGNALQRARAVARSMQPALLKGDNESETAYVKRLEQVAAVGARRLLNDVSKLEELTDSEIDDAARAVVGDLPGAAIDAMTERVLRGEIVRLVVAEREDARRRVLKNKQQSADESKRRGDQDTTAKVTKIGWRFP